MLLYINEQCPQLKKIYFKKLHYAGRAMLFPLMVYGAFVYEKKAMAVLHLIVNGILVNGKEKKLI